MGKKSSKSKKNTHKTEARPGNQEKKWAKRAIKASKMPIKEKQDQETGEKMGKKSNKSKKNAHKRRKKLGNRRKNGQKEQ